MSKLRTLVSEIGKLVARPELRETPPSSVPLWRLWMHSETLPTLVAADQLGVLSSLQKGPQTEGQLRSRLQTSPRFIRVILQQLSSLGLLQFHRSRYSYALTSAGRKALTRPWRLRLSEMIRFPVTPESYLSELQKNSLPKRRYQQTDLLGKLAAHRFHFPILCAAVDSGLIKLVAEQRVSMQSLAETSEIPERYLNEILDVLKPYGLFRRDSGGNITLSELGHHYLSEESPYHWGGIFTLMTSNPANPLSLVEAAREERRQLENPDDGKMMEHVMSDSLARTFARHMHSQGAAAAVAVAQHPVFQRANRVLDVAGGGGTYSLELARRHRHLSCDVLELAPMDKVAKEWARLQKLWLRVGVEAGNMFHAGDWPKQTHDLIFFSHVLHDWDQDKNLMLLRNAYSSLPKGGKVVLHEILADGSGHSREIAAGFSVTLFKWTEGRQYRSDELLSLLAQAGFQALEVSTIHGPSSLIIAEKR